MAAARPMQTDEPARRQTRLPPQEAMLSCTQPPNAAGVVLNAARESCLPKRSFEARGPLHLNADGDAATLETLQTPRTRSTP
jgi:hypothetical protein